MKGFFATSELTSSRVSIPLLPRCGACGLHKVCLSPKMPAYGEFKKKILIVGEAPGEDEDKVGRPFVGKSGQYLRKALRKLGVDMDADCLVTNSAICRPPHNKFADKAVEHCRPNLVKVVKESKPNVIILLGKRSVQSLMGWLWKRDSGNSIERWVGWRIPCQKINSWVCPTWHPVYILRNLSESKESGKVLERIFEKHLEDAIALSGSGRPYNGSPPDYGQSIVKAVSPSVAASTLTEMGSQGQAIAFDYETTTLQPDGQHARIVCCSVSNGEKTIAYPWIGEAPDATRKLLWSDIPKIGWNLKFEERWTKKEFGKGVRNWMWDGMIASHILDNRRGICSLKFQAFVRLGVEPYDESISPFLKAESSNEPNRIEDVSLSNLLTYCGMDSKLEWEIGTLQMRELGK